MKVLILGHGGHGKDTFAEMLGLSFASSSRWALDLFLFDYLNDYREDINIPKYSNHDEAFDDRHNWRDFWHQEISRFNSDDKAKLAKDIMSVNECYVGMRCDKEYKECERIGLFDLVFWVDSSHRVGDESSSSMGISFNKNKMIWVDNNHSINHLHCLAHLYKNKIMELSDG